jgi:hypothetical protein
VLRAAGETETTQENIQDWLELDEGDPGQTEEEICSMIFLLFLFNRTTSIIQISIYLFSKSFCCILRLSFASLIRMTSPPPPISPD